MCMGLGMAAAKLDDVFLLQIQHVYNDHAVPCLGAFLWCLHLTYAAGR